MYDWYVITNMSARTVNAKSGLWDSNLAETLEEALRLARSDGKSRKVWCETTNTLLCVISPR